MDTEIENRIERLEKQVADILKNPPMPDHFHSGFDASRVRLQDLDTIIFKQATINPGNLVDGAGETQQVTGVTGANLGDFVLVSAPYDLQDITVTAYVQATGVVEIRLQNESGSTINLASGTWRILVLRKII